MTRREVEAVTASAECGEVGKVTGLLHNIVAVTICIGHHKPLVLTYELVYVRTLNAKIALGDLFYLSVRTACVVGGRKIDTLVGFILVVHIVLAVHIDYIRIYGVIAVLRRKEKLRIGVKLLHVLAVCIVHYRSVIAVRNSCRKVYHVGLLLRIIYRLRSPCTVSPLHERVFVGYLNACLVEPVYKVGGLCAEQISVAVPAQ